MLTIGKGCGEGKTYSIHGFSISDDVKIVGELYSFNVAPNGAEDGLYYGTDLSSADVPIVVFVGISPIDKGHLHIDLSEFWLTVFATIFVTKAASELEVIFDGT